MATIVTDSYGSARALRVVACVLSAAAFLSVALHSTGITLGPIWIRGDDPPFKPTSPGMIILFSASILFCLLVFRWPRIASVPALFGLAVALVDPWLWTVAFLYLVAIIVAWLSARKPSTGAPQDASG